MGHIMNDIKQIIMENFKKDVQVMAFKTGENIWCEVNGWTHFKYGESVLTTSDILETWTEITRQTLDEQFLINGNDLTFSGSVDFAGEKVVLTCIITPIMTNGIVGVDLYLKFAPAVKTIQELGIPQEILESIAKLNGVHVFAGATRAGKTSTMLGIGMGLIENTNDDFQVFRSQDNISTGHRNIVESDLFVDENNFYSNINKPNGYANVIGFDGLKTQEMFIEGLELDSMINKILITLHAPTMNSAIKRLWNVVSAHKEPLKELQKIKTITMQRETRGEDGEISIVWEHLVMNDDVIKELIR